MDPLEKDFLLVPNAPEVTHGYKYLGEGGLSVCEECNDPSDAILKEISPRLAVSTGSWDQNRAHGQGSQLQGLGFPGNASPDEPWQGKNCGWWCLCSLS